MECFIKKIWQGKEGEAHNYFIRFGKGKFENRAVLNLQKVSKIKLRGSFEWANDFVKLASELGGGKVTGIILSKLDISSVLSKSNVSGNSEAKQGGLFYQNKIPEQELSLEAIKDLADNSYASLLDIEAADFSLKIKKKLPKPGKSSEAKVDDKFCQLEADLKYWLQIKEAFMLPECKKARISHNYIINDLVFPQCEKDFAKIRELAKRKGTIIRISEIDSQKTEEEKNFEA